MLTELHVKNLALIKEEEIEFDKGLNILTGETGAGKSIILGALSLALGGKVEKDMLRDPSKEALAEAVFSVGEKEAQELMALDIEVYDGEVILSRKITESRTTARINGETVPAPVLKKAGAILIDIYGQNEHQSLLNVKKHKELLDEYAASELASVLPDLKEAYSEYTAKTKELSGADIDESERKREASFLAHEVEEIEQAALKPGEDEEVETEYRRLTNSQKINVALSAAYQLTGGDDGASASDMTGRAVRELDAVMEYDDKIKELLNALSDADAILSDFNRDIASYMADSAFDQAHFDETEARLDLINDLKGKYGSTIEEINAALEDKKQRLEKLADYDAYLAELKSSQKKAEECLIKLCEKATEIRKKCAKDLTEKVKKNLLDLNFLDVQFDVYFTKGDYTATGWDNCEFLISTNPGEPLRPLIKVASGGEMSRIMLALKTVLAEQDDIDTMIFDEIDAGISGRTAQSVAEKLKYISANHQVICITHLPQIAAQSDRYFRIEKTSDGRETVSAITPLDEDGIIEELSRMLGGTVISDTVRENAKEMRRLAKNT